MTFPLSLALTIFSFTLKYSVTTALIFLSGFYFVCMCVVHVVSTLRNSLDFIFCSNVWVIFANVQWMLAEKEKPCPQSINLNMYLLNKCLKHSGHPRSYLFSNVLCQRWGGTELGNPLQGPQVTSLVPALGGKSLHHGFLFYICDESPKLFPK